MIQLNEYFNGNVKSLTVNAKEGRKMVGVMAPVVRRFLHKFHLSK